MVSCTCGLGPKSQIPNIRHDGKFNADDEKTQES
jgi:hypothetical protein